MLCGRPRHEMSLFQLCLLLVKVTAHRGWLPLCCTRLKPKSTTFSVTVRLTRGAFALCLHPEANTLVFSLKRCWVMLSVGHFHSNDRQRREGCVWGNRGLTLNARNISEAHIQPRFVVSRKKWRGWVRFKHPPSVFNSTFAVKTLTCVSPKGITNGNENVWKHDEVTAPRRESFCGSGTRILPGTEELSPRWSLPLCRV